MLALGFLEDMSSDEYCLSLGSVFAFLSLPEGKERIALLLEYLLPLSPGLTVQHCIP